MKKEIMYETIKSWSFRVLINEKKREINIQRGWLEYAQPIETDKQQIALIKTQLATDKDFIKVSENEFLNSKLVKCYEVVNVKNKPTVRVYSVNGECLNFDVAIYSKLRTLIPNKLLGNELLLN